MEVNPFRGKGDPSQRYTHDKDGVVEDIQAAAPLESIYEGVRLDSSGPGAQKRPRKMASKQSISWPFHRRMASEAPSSILSGSASHSRRPSSGWNNLKSFFKVEEDSASLSSSPLVPDYVVHYIRGETPETLAKKREQRTWGERTAVVTPQRERFHSQHVELDTPWSARRQSNIDGIGFANEDRQVGLGSFFNGWKGGATYNVMLAFLLLVVAAVCLILSISRQVVSGETVIFSGSCATATTINTGLHVAINMFAVTILAGSNYVFQVLSSPTRLELASAHNKKQWLDIGIPSLRNLLHVSGIRTALIAVALLSAVTTQIIYNAIIFTTPTGFKSDIVVVTSDFLSGAPFTNGTAASNQAGMSQADLLSLQNDASAGKLVNLAAVPCLQQVNGEFDATYDALVLVTKLTATRNSVVQTGKTGDMLQLSSMSSVAIRVPIDETVVDRCLARQGLPQTCEVSVSSLLLGIVGMLHLISLFSMTAMLTWRNFEPLVSLGDAIRSFMRNPDPTTATACFLDKHDVGVGRWGIDEAKYFTPTDHYWFFTPSIGRWVLSVVSWIMITAPAAAAVALIIEREPTGELTPLGLATPYTMFTFGDSMPLTHLQATVLAAVPQLLIAILYLTTNSLLTTYWLSHELSFFAICPRALRVTSDPVGYQTTSLYLTLPRPVSWILYFVFVALSFTLSQAVFPAIISSGTTARNNNTQIIGIGFSTLALLILLALLVVLIVGIVALGLRRVPAATLADGVAKGNPLALRGGSCSAVLSAKCHPVPWEPERSWRCPLSYGVVNDAVGANQVGHCAFSGVSVGAVDTSKIYA